MKRILVLGISGTGKTRLAKTLSEITKLPVVHLDTIFWDEEWRERDPQLVANKTANALKDDEWIIEGYIEPLSNARLKRADTVIYLDYPGWQALSGGLKRRLKHRNTARPELPKTNTDKQGLAFFLGLLRRIERPEIETSISGFENKLTRLSSRAKTRTYLRNLSKKQQE